MKYKNKSSQRAVQYQNCFHEQSAVRVWKTFFTIRVPLLLSLIVGHNTGILKFKTRTILVHELLVYIPYVLPSRPMPLPGAQYVRFETPRLVFSNTVLLAW